MTTRPGSAWVLVLVCITFFGCATAAPQPPTVDVTGTWIGEVTGGFGGSAVTLTLQQAGANVTGNLMMAGAALTGSSPTGPVSGTVSGNELSLSFRNGGADFTVSGDQMTRSSPNARWSLKRQ
jgi:hypothetical protein